LGLYDPRLMDMDRVVRYVFILYCATVGVVLVVVPWSPGWDQMLSFLSTPFELLRRPLLRGALSGFGLVHLVWCLHDVHDLARGDAAEHG
jgi:hypothetical protein